MHSLSAWFTKNPVAANLLMLLILAAGIATATSLRIEGFPALPPSSISIYTAYAGADASQVDQGITRKIETALEGMPGVKKISSSSYEGVSQIHIQKNSRFNIDRFQNEISTRLDTIRDLPKQAEKPVISREEFSVIALLVQVYGETDDLTLQKTGRQVKEALLADPAIAKLTSFGMRPYEISIELSESKLSAYGITMSDVAQVVEDNSFDYTSGTLKSESGKIILRADTRAFDLKAFQAMPLVTSPEGDLITLGSVAQITDGFKEMDSFSRFQGSPSVGMMVYTTQQGDLVQISREARKIIDRLKDRLPEHIHVDIWGESSIYMKARLNLLKTNALQGLAIVFLLLALFLNLKLAFWVAMGIPISMAGAMILMGPMVLDYSLNDITTFGLIIVLGILVDDAVVVGESVFEQRRQVQDPIAGTITGVCKVSTATVFGCFTTIAAFFPSLLIDNELGKIFSSFSMVVIICLLVSLIESKLILPAHLAAISIDTRRPVHLGARIWQKVQNPAQKGLEQLKTKIYAPVLKHALAHRYCWLVFFITGIVLCAGMVFKGDLRTVFYPEVPGQIITVNMEMINGAPLNLTVKNLDKLEQAAKEVNQEAMQETGSDRPPIVNLLSALNDKENLEIYAELQPETLRQINTMDTMKRWQDKVGRLEGIKKLKFSGSFETAGGFEIQLYLKNSDLLASAVQDLMDQMGKIHGVQALHSDLSAGSPMIRLALKPQARHFGITAADLAHYIGNAFGGLEVQRFLRQTDEVNVYVKYNFENRKYISDLLNARIRIPSGEWLPLTQVARIIKGKTPSGITRKNGLEVATIEADLDKDVVSPPALFEILNQTLIPDLMSKYPGIGISEAGELEEMAEMKGGLIKSMIIILLGIYALIAIPLKSYVQPLIIMSVIPFAFVGAVLGHILTGFPLSILSILGMLGAAGVVVNDSLVMLTRFNEIRTQGHSFDQALCEAGLSRFRAIFLTTATTVCGLMPLIFETSEQAQYLIPAAISLAFGELCATPVTLVLIPILLAMGKDVKSRFKAVFHTAAKEEINPF